MASDQRRRVAELLETYNRVVGGPASVRRGVSHPAGHFPTGGVFPNRRSVSLPAAVLPGVRTGRLSSGRLRLLQVSVMSQQFVLWDRILSQAEANFP